MLNIYFIILTFNAINRIIKKYFTILCKYYFTNQKQKTMKKTSTLLTPMLLFVCGLFAQTPKAVTNYQMFTVMNIMPKHGMEKQFEAGITAHNTKYHSVAPYKARCATITHGAGSDGWYVWVMGPMTYTDMDNEPNGNKEHDDDWSKNVDTYVDQYGESKLWKLREDLSYTPANYNPSNVDVWGITIKPGMRYKFDELMKKWKGMWETKKYTFCLRVFNSDLMTEGHNASIVFSFDKYAEFDLDISWKNDYEAMYGAGSWASFWKDWNDCVSSADEHLRKYLK
jgi:hypothetical protein